MPYETKEEFIARHGSIAERSPDGKLWIFADGARLSEYPGGYSASEPPDDPKERLSLIADYHRAVVQRIADQLSRLKSFLKGSAPVFSWDSKLGPMPHGIDAPALARFLQEMAAAPKQRLAETEAALAALPTNRTDDERARRLKRALRRRELAQQAQQRQVLEATI